MRTAERASYLKLLSDGEGVLRANYPQPAYASAFAALKRNEVYYVAEVGLQFLAYQCSQFLLRVCDVPPVEVGRLAVVVVEHLRENPVVSRIAECLRRGRYPLPRVLLAGEVGQGLSRVSVSVAH